MGADMLIAVIPMRDGTAMNYQLGISLLKKCKMEDFDEFIDEAFGGSVPAEDEDKDSQASSEKDRVIAEAESVLMDAADALDSRYVGSFSHKGMVFYVAGGLSWGDEPCEQYALFRKCLCLPPKVLKACGVVL